MSGNIYLFLEGIPGESTNFHFANWLDVMSFSIGNAMEIDQEARTGGGGTSTSGAADPEDISVDTKMSLASPLLLECCAAGAVIPRGRLVQCNVINKYRTIVSDYAFGDSIISGVSLSASGGEIPSETITINYGSVIWRYNCYGHFNPLVLLGSTAREWSILKAKPGKADESAHEAAQIANSRILENPEPSDSAFSASVGKRANVTASKETFSYDQSMNIISPTKAKFSIGIAVDMTADEKAARNS